MSASIPETMLLSDLLKTTEFASITIGEDTYTRYTSGDIAL